MVVRISYPTTKDFRRAFYKPNGKLILNALYTVGDMMEKFGPRISPNPIYAAVQRQRAQAILNHLAKEAEDQRLPWVCWKPGTGCPVLYGFTTDMDKLFAYRDARRVRLVAHKKRQKAIEDTVKHQQLLLTDKTA